MRWRIAMVFAVACSGSTGVFVSVSTPPGTDHVEMLVAPTTCDSCPGSVAWDTLAPHVAGKIFDLDSDERNIISVPGGDTFTLKLEAKSDKEANPDRIALVAFDNLDNAIGIGVLREPQVSMTEASSFSLRLDPIAEIDPANPADSGAHVWRAPMGGAMEDPATYASCVATANQDGVEFYLPSDHDCDNQAPECDDFWFKSVSNVETPCFTNSSPFQPGTCLLGGSRCSDGLLSTCNYQSGIGLPAYCVPDDVCDCSDTLDARNCLRDTLETAYASMTPALTYLDCSFPSDGTNLCTGAYTPVGLDLPQKTCTNVAVYTASLPLTTPIVSSNGAPMTAPPFGSGQPGLTLSLNTAMPCSIRLGWDSSGSTTAAPHPPTYLVLDITLSSVAHIIMPLRFEFPSCTSSPQAACLLEGSGSGSDHVFACGA